jgi:hypothetical protein
MPDDEMGGGAELRDDAADAQHHALVGVDGTDVDPMHMQHPADAHLVHHAEVGSIGIE